MTFRLPSLISVVMPNYNGTRFMGCAIESVIAQSLEDFELIIVDDGSTDSSVAIAEKYMDEDRRVKLARHAKRRGVSAARNTGVANVVSPLVSFMDSDDLMAGDRLIRLVERFSQRSEPCVFYSDVIRMDEGTKSVQSRDSTNLPRPSGMVLGKLITGRFRFVAGTIATLKSVIEGVGPYDERLTWGEDFELCLRLAKEFPFQFDQLSTYGHRIYPGNTTALIPKRERWKQQAAILERHLPGALPYLSPQERRAAYDYIFSCYIASNQLAKIPRLGFSDAEAFLSMVSLPVRALV